ncbi:MAG: response regulator [Sphaerochaeta sp.]
MYTLLIADDEPLELDAIELLIKRAKLPLRLIKARNGYEAVQLSDRHRPDIVFLDIRMPGMDGIEAARLIREQNSECQIVFLTAWSTFEFAQQAIRLSASEYLVKPVQRKEVYDLFDRLIAQLDRRKEDKALQDDQVKQALNLFSREFFAALKYGRVEEEVMENYFSLQGIRHRQGIALIIQGLDEGQLRHFFSPFNTQVCYFPSPDRTTALLFTDQPEKIIEQISFQEQMNLTTIGSGVPFTALVEIPHSISTASIAFNWAQSEHLGLQRYSDVLLSPLDQHQNHLLIQEIVGHTLEGSASQARSTAHLLIDRLLHAMDEEQAIEELGEALTLFTYEVGKNISLLSIGRVPKNSVMEQEFFLMDLIDLAALAVQTDRRDRYERAFAYVSRYIDEHIEIPHSVEEVSSLVGINAKYFSKLCKSYLGATFVEYVNTKKMERAHQLLKAGAASVKEVAEATGFVDTNYFSRLFRQHWGVSPSSLLQ